MVVFNSMIYDKQIPRLNERFSGDRFYDIARHTIATDYPLHSHDFFEIDFVLSGKAITEINNVSYEISEGSILFLTPADVHNYILLSPEPLILINIFFTFSMISSNVWKTVQFDKNIALLPERDFINIKATCETLIEERSAGDFPYSFIIKTGIEWIIICMTRNMSKSPLVSQNNKRDLSKALAFIYENFTNTITLNEVSKTVHISPMHFSKCFHNLMGVTFQEYLLNLRLDFAMSLVKTTDLPLYLVCSSAGFGTSDHFSRAFKKKFGHPPSYFRN